MVFGWFFVGFLLSLPQKTRFLFLGGGVELLVFSVRRFRLFLQVSLMCSYLWSCYF